MIISTKAGFDMWDGPYGNWGSKKYLTASLDQSLSRMGLDYVDIFYHHRPDPETPIEETMDALAGIVRQGKALYVGISNYSAAEAKVALETLESMGVHCLLHQPNYSMLNRWIEERAAGSARAARGGHHRLLPAGAGAFDAQVFKRGTGGIPGRRARRASRTDHAGAYQKAQRLKRSGCPERADLAQLALAWVLRADG